VVPWKLPVVVIAIAVPIVAGFYLGGPGVGVAVGALVAVVLVVIAARQRPRGPIGEAPSRGSRRRLLVVATRPVEDAESVRAIAAEAVGEGGGGEADVLVLAPARIGFLDRWASDVEGARRAAQQALVITVASLAKAGVAAEARVGDEDPVQAIEDQIGSFPATEVILVTAEPEEDPAGEAAAAELESRLRAGFRRLTISGRPAR
jgi:hypothetical protein